MSDQNLFKVTAERQAEAMIDNVGYLDMYKRSVSDPVKFWEEEGKRIDWVKPYSKIKDVSFSEKDLHIKWFYDGTLNVAANCLDRHLDEKGDQTAIIWEGDNPEEDRKISYRELYGEVCKFANALKTLGACPPALTTQTTHTLIYNTSILTKHACVHNSISVMNLI